MKDVEKEKMKVVENLVEKEALKLVKEGFSITPLIGQRPIGEATNDPERIRFIWGRFPEANIGLEFGPKSNICGLQVSPLQEGLVSLKAQTRGHLSLPDGYVSLRGLIEECGSIEETPQAETLMGVRVYFFQYYPNFSIPKEFKKGLRVLKRGILLLPPSIYVSGKRFLYKEGRELGNFPLARIPAFLIKKRVVKDKTKNRLRGFIDNCYENSNQRLCGIGKI